MSLLSALGGGEWSPPTDDRLISQETSTDAKACSSFFSELQRERLPSDLEASAAPRLSFSRGVVWPHEQSAPTSSQSSRPNSRGSRGEEHSALAPSQAVPVAASVPGGARPLPLERSRLPTAGNSGMAWRRPQSTSKPVSPASPASVVAGAIASGWSPPKARAPSTGRLRADGAAGADQALVSSMASRLAQVEKLNQQQATKLAKQAQELDALRADRAGGTSSSNCSGRAESMQELRAQRDAYRLEVEEMKQFLADYGLTWVGDDDEEEPDESDKEVVEAGDAQSRERQGADNPGRARSGSIAEKLGRPPAPDGVQLDIKVIESRVQSLNAMVEKESAHIVSSRVGGVMRARLVADDTPASPLTFFRDGVKLGSRAFMAFELAPAQQLIRDILDGYFPFALKDDHPDGVEMKVLDRTPYTFTDWLKTHAQSDPDLTDAGCRLAPVGVHSLRRVSAAEGFLARLPEKVVRDGRICEVRGPIARQMAGNSSTRDESAPVGERDAGEEVSLLLVGREASAQAARLQVKVEGGERVVFHMETSHCIGDLEDALAKWRASHSLPDAGTGGRRFELRTAFPRKAYSDRSQTLEEAGLVPSATLFVGLVEWDEGARVV